MRPKAWESIRRKRRARAEDALWLRDVHRLTIREIAKRMELSERTIERYLAGK